MMKLQKLDRRYDGNDRFTHRVEFYGQDRVRQWIQTRNWLWTQFGASAELCFARDHYFDGDQPKWAWDSEKSSVYLIDEALAMFLLKWESWK